MDREVYIVPPKEANYNGIWLLNKFAYGLSDASLYWYKKVNQLRLSMVVQCQNWILLWSTGVMIQTS